MITIGTFLLVFLLLYGMVNTKDYLMFLLKVLIVFSVYINIGYFIKVGSFELAYAEILIFFFVITGLLHKGRAQLSIPSVLVVISLGLTIVTGYWLLINNPSPPMVLPVGSSWDNYIFGFESMSVAQFNGTHLQRSVRIILFIIMYYFVDKHIIQNDKRSTEIKRFVVRIAIISAWIGIAEQLSSLIFSYDFIAGSARSIFGLASSQLHAIIQRGSFPALQGLMLEPGHYAQSFLPAIVILFRDKMFTEGQRFKVFVLFSYVLLFSGSFTGFAILLAMTILYLFSQRQKILIKLASGIGLATTFLLFIKWIRLPMLDYYLIRTNALLTNQTIAGSSEGTRMLSIKSALHLFYDNPLFGIGFGTMDAFGLIPSMLANVGLLGTFIWFMFMFRGFSKTKVINAKWLILLLPLLFFIGDTGTIYSVNILLIFCFVFRKKVELKSVEPSSIKIFSNENHKVSI